MIDLNPYRDEPDGVWCEGCKQNQPWTSACPACGGSMCDACERSIGCAACERHPGPAIRVYRATWWPDEWATDVEPNDEVLVRGEPTLCELLRDTLYHLDDISILVWERWEALRDTQYGQAVTT